MILEVKETDKGWEFTATDKEVVAVLRADRHENDCLLHNEVYRWDKETAKLLREMFYDVRGFLREKGINLIIPCAEGKPKKTMRFCRFMGFECFSEIDGISFAVMEA